MNEITGSVVEEYRNVDICDLISLLDSWRSLPAGEALPDRYTMFVNGKEITDETGAPLQVRFFADAGGTSMAEANGREWFYAHFVSEFQISDKAMRRNPGRVVGFLKVPEIAPELFEQPEEILEEPPIEPATNGKDTSSWLFIPHATETPTLSETQVAYLPRLPHWLEDKAKRIEALRILEGGGSLRDVGGGVGVTGSTVLGFVHRLVKKMNLLDTREALRQYLRAQTSDAPEAGTTELFIRPPRKERDPNTFSRGSRRIKSEQGAKKKHHENIQQAIRNDFVKQTIQAAKKESGRGRDQDLMERKISNIVQAIEKGTLVTNVRNVEIDFGRMADINATDKNILSLVQGMTITIEIPPKESEAEDHTHAMALLNHLQSMVDNPSFPESDLGKAMHARGIRRLDVRFKKYNRKLRGLYTATRRVLAA